MSLSWCLAEGCVGSEDEEDDGERKEEPRARPSATEWMTRPTKADWARWAWAAVRVSSAVGDASCWAGWEKLFERAGWVERAVYEPSCSMSWPRGE